MLPPAETPPVHKDRGRDARLTSCISHFLHFTHFTLIFISAARRLCQSSGGEVSNRIISLVKGWRKPSTAA